jgi:hypothetical protein
VRKRSHSRSRLESPGSFAGWESRAEPTLARATTSRGRCRGGDRRGRRIVVDRCWQRGPECCRQSRVDPRTPSRRGSRDGLSDAISNSLGRESTGALAEEITGSGGENLPNRPNTTIRSWRGRLTGRPTDLPVPFIRPLRASPTVPTTTSPRVEAQFPISTAGKTDLPRLRARWTSSMARCISTAQATASLCLVGHARSGRTEGSPEIPASGRMELVDRAQDTT